MHLVWGNSAFISVWKTEETFESSLPCIHDNGVVLGVSM